MAAASGTAGARGAAALARALVADGAVAEGHYREAIRLFGGTRIASYRGRARLCYGEWLRRTDRRAEAGTELRAAFDAFVTMGAKGLPNAPAASLRPPGGRCAPTTTSPALN